MDTNNWIGLAQAVGTFAAAVVALFGARWAASLFPLRLTLSVVSAEGEATTATYIPQGSQVPVSVPARYYHVAVKNRNKYPAGHDVRLMLVCLEKIGPDGRPHVEWSGGIPLVWKPGELYGSPANPVGHVVGRDSVADLCRVIKDHDLALLVPLKPNNLQITFPGPAHIFVTVRAVADEGQSLPLRIEVAWDGSWADGESEMARHLVVRAV